MRAASFRVSRLRQDERGNVAMIFALAAPALIAFVMAVFDYGDMVTQKLRLQSAADAAALALGPQASYTSVDALKAQAAKLVNNYSPDKNFLVSKVEVTNSGTELLVGVQADYTLKYFKAPGVPAVFPLNAFATSAAVAKTNEIAIVMDNSGSMLQSAGGDSKMKSAIDAANKLVDTMMSSPLAATRTKFSLVPFTLAVKIGNQYANQSWMDRTGASPKHYDNFLVPAGYTATRWDLFAALNVQWAGCVETRPDPWGVTDAAPTSGQPASLFVPMAAPDEPGDKGVVAASAPFYYNSYIDDDPHPECNGQITGNTTNYDLAERKLCKYLKSPLVSDTTSGRGPNSGCNAQPLMRLTSDTAAIHTAINGMVANGSTNLLEGFMWGWRTISPNAPFPDGRAYGLTTNQKFIVLLTDGINSWGQINNHNRSEYSPMGYYTNARLGPAPADAAAARAQMDAKTLTACTNAKAQGITVYTVGFSVSSYPIDAAGLNLLNKCASDPSMAFVANNSSSIVTVFQAIARNITGLRLAR